MEHEHPLEETCAECSKRSGTNCINCKNPQIEKIETLMNSLDVSIADLINHANEDFNSETYTLIPLNILQDFIQGVFDNVDDINFAREGE